MSPASPSPSPSLDALSRTQRDAMKVLWDFVDALRDIKKEDQVDVDVRRAVRAAAFPVVDDVQCVDDTVDADADLAHFTRGMRHLLAHLSHTIKQIDELEAAQKQANASARTAIRGADERPVAPAGLLSLRDFSVLQAALEVFFCWSVHPLADPQLILPIDRRRPTKTLDISRYVLQWGSQVAAATGAMALEEMGRHVVTSARTMLQVLLLPQIQPILLPKYVVDIVALLVYGETNDDFDSATRQQCHQMLATLLRVLPLRLSMTSVRAALGQCNGSNPTSRTGASAARVGGVVVAFKKRCGKLLSQLMMEDGGVLTTIEMLLGAVDEGNTQARMQVATLICQCPADVKPAVYARSLARQVRVLFGASERQNKMIRETAVVLANEMATRFREIFETEFLVSLVRPLLVYEGNSQRAASASENEITDCVASLHLLLCGPPPSRPLVLALVPLFRPLVHLYGFAVSSKSFLMGTLHEILIAFIKVVPQAALLLQVAVLPVFPSLPTNYQSLPFYRSESSSSLYPWKPLHVFTAGGSGGIAMHEHQVQQHIGEPEDESMPLRLAVVALVQLLAAKELETSPVVGDLFSSLLLTYMNVRQSTKTDTSVSDDEKQTTTKHDEMPSANAEEHSVYQTIKEPRDPLGLELTLSLLLAIIESLGPSVLRSAETVLQCITTVLGMFARSNSSLVDAQEDATAGDEDDDEDDDVLTICLGLVMTILEAGVHQRSESEEAELRAMLPVLEQLSHYRRPQIAELATDARARILCRGSTTPTVSAKKGLSFAETLQDAAKDLQSPLVPLRARGVVMLTKLVRRSQPHRGDPLWTQRITQLTQIFMDNLADAESYVFLAAVQGLAALCDAHPTVAIPLLTANVRDKSNSFEKRIKLSEALLFTAKRCGETLPVYAKEFVYSYLECIRPPPGSIAARPRSAQAAKKKPFSLIEEIDPDEETKTKQQTTPLVVDTEQSEEETAAANAAVAEAATLRASCLSNLAEVAAMLQWSLVPFAVDILSCVFGILQLELNMAATSVVAVRRGAVFLLKYVLQLLGSKALEVVADQLKTIYHTLKHVERVDKDDVVRFHAQQALQTLDEIMRAELFPSQDYQDAAGPGGLRALRIVKH